MYLDGWMKPPPYGLMILHGISAPDEGGMHTVALRVVEVLQNHGPSAPVFQTVHWKDLQKVNDLLNVLCPVS